MEIFLLFCYSNIDILRFIKTFGKKFQKETDFLNSLCDIVTNFTLNDINSTFKKKFFKYKFHRIFGNLMNILLIHFYQM